MSEPAKHHEVRPWGQFWVLEDSEDYKVKKLLVNPGQRMSLQSHQKREEIWTVVQGNGEGEVNGNLFDLTPGAVSIVYPGDKHRIMGGTETLVIIEVQRGECMEDDITRYEDDYGR